MQKGTGMRGTDLVILGMLVYLMWKSNEEPTLPNDEYNTGSSCAVVNPYVLATPQSNVFPSPSWTRTL